MYFDCHAHLQDEAFAADLPAVLATLVAAGVRRVVLPASDYADASRALEIAFRYPGLYVCLGYHPHEAKQWQSDSAAQLAELKRYWTERCQRVGRQPLVLAIGEIGLDYHYEFSERQQQQQVFLAQLRLAHELDLPVVLHVREAFADFFALLQEAEAGGYLRSGMYCHCYSGSWESAELLLSKGCYLGFDGPLTYKNGRKAQEIVTRMPLDRLLLETDSPYLTPEPYRGKRNDPSKLPLIAAKAAALRQLTAAELAQICSQNALNFYRLPAAAEQLI